MRIGRTIGNIIGKVIGRGSWVRIAKELVEYDILTDGIDQFRIGINVDGNFQVDNFTTVWETIFEV